jgi:RNA polymerase sigma-70 factor (ECF subfamily)
MRAMGPCTDQSDETLAVRAERGDQEAVSILVRRHSPRLYGFLQRYHPDRDDCDDLLQETWIRALGNLGRFDPEKRFSTWLFQIALNLCRDLARRDEVRSRFRRGVQEMQKETKGITVEQKMDAMRAIQAIETLPLHQKEALLLRYYHGFPEAEVAEILGCPRGTVKSRLHQAVKALRVKLGATEGEP